MTDNASKSRVNITLHGEDLALLKQCREVLEKQTEKPQSLVAVLRAALVSYAVQEGSSV